MIRHGDDRCVRMFRPIFGYAGKDYVCDGCGEIPISKGSVMMTSVGKYADGTFHRAHYCIRCIIVIQVKKIHSKTGEVWVEPGDLKFNRLANQFKKNWMAFVRKLPDLKEHDVDGLHQMTSDLFASMGLDFDTICFRTDTSELKAMRLRRAERRKKRKQRKEEEAMRIKEYRQAAKNADKALTAMDLLMNELGKAQLQVRHTAAVSGDLVVACHKLVEVRNKIAAVLQDARKQLGDLQA